MDAERNIDALLLELEGEDHNSSSDQEDQNNDGPEAPAAGGSQAAGVGNLNDDRRNISRHISSSSAKRRVIKDTDCLFCPVELNRDTIEGHLQASQNCLTLYLRKLHLKTLDAVILKIYPCLFCQIPFHKLSLHLQSKPECLDQFKARFGVTSLSAVIKRVSNLRRQEYKSRRSLERQFESSKAKEKKKARLETVTTEFYLNEHLQQTAFSNFKKCCNCLCDLSSAEEVTKDTDIVRTEYEFESLSHYRRAGKLFLCRFCKIRKENIPEFENSCFAMTGLEEESKIVFVPDMPPANTEDPDGRNLQPLLQFIGKNVKVMVPAAIDSLRTFPNNVPSKKLSSFEIQHILSGNKNLDAKLLASIYENQVSKFQSLDKFCDLFTGEIEDNAGKTVTNLKPCSGLEKKIRGSIKSDLTRNEEVHKKIAQYGKFCLFLSTEIPVGHQTVATNLMQRGFVVTTSYSGEASQELNRKYFVHQGHSANSDCTLNCQKITIEEYLETSPEMLELTKENISTYICSVENFVNSFVSNIITSPVAPLSAKEFHFQTKFNEKGIARLEGIIWPRCLQKMNLLKLDQKLGIEETKAIKQDYLDKIKSSIVSTSDPEVLKTQFRLSEVECDKIQSFIAKHQTHFCGNCLSCRDPPLPSLQAMLCVTPDDEHLTNVSVAIRFAQFFKSKLLMLGQEEMEESTSFQWLEAVVGEFEDETIQPNLWRISNGVEEFLFKVDIRLADLMEEYDYCILLAAYHYSISCVNPKDENRVIFDRPHLSDSFLKPFNIFILKAAVGTTNLQVLNSTEDYSNNIWTPPSTIIRTEIPLIQHKEVSLSEALVLLDNNKLNTKASSGVQFVYTGPGFEGNSFKKRKEPVGNCFTLSNQPANSFYERLETMVSRFIRRMNGKDLLLCEVVTYYEYVGPNKSEELFEVYKNKIDRIEDTTEQCITNGAFYPEIILCDFGDFGHVLKKRRKMQVLNYPNFNKESFEFKHSQVLLYSDIQNVDDLTKDAVEAAFLAVANDGERMIDRNKKMFLFKARAEND